MHPGKRDGFLQIKWNLLLSTPVIDIIVLLVNRSLQIYWKNVKLCRIFHCMEILFQWINFSRYVTIPWCNGVANLSNSKRHVIIYVCFKFYPKYSDGRIPRVWSKEEEEIWQANWFKCDDRFQRPWWGCWPLRCQTVAFPCKFCTITSLVCFSARPCSRLILLSGFLFSQLIFLCILTLLNMHYIYFTLVLLAFLYVFREYPSSSGRNFDKEKIVTFAIHMSFESVSVLWVEDVLTLQPNTYE